MSHPINPVKKVFNAWASSGKADELEHHHTYSVQHILSTLSLNTPFHFLDIGCGNGWVVRHISQSQNCSLAWGLDLCENMIQAAINRQQDEKEHYLCSDVLEWDTSMQFDIIFSMEALYYMFPIQKALSCLYTLTAPNGHLAIGIDYYEENKGSHHWPDLIDVPMIRHDMPTWKSLFHEAGFSDIILRQIKNPNGNEPWEREQGTLFIWAKKPILPL